MSLIDEIGRAGVVGIAGGGFLHQSAFPGQLLWTYLAASATALLMIGMAVRDNRKDATS